MEFVKFKRAVHAQFNQLAAGADMLFLTNVDKTHYGIVTLIQLDNIAIALNKKLQESKTESFIKTRTKDTTELELKFNIAKHIIDVKLQEQEDRLLESEKKAKRQKILDLMAKKQDAELEGKSLEELAKELEALN